MGYIDETPETEVEETLQLADVGENELHVVHTHVETGHTHTAADAVSARLPTECLTLFGDGPNVDPDDLTAEEREWLTAESDRLDDVIEVGAPEVDDSVETIDAGSPDAWEVSL